MSTQRLLNRDSFLAGADLSALQFTFVKQSTSANFTVLSATAASSPIIGVLQNKPTSAQTAEVALPGSVAKVIAGGTVTAGDRVTATTGGQAITTTTNKDWYAGIALDAAVSGDLFRVLLAPGIVNV